MGWWKELWCGHVDKLESEEFLEKKRMGDGLAFQTFHNYEIYALHYKCLKCGRKTITRKRIIIL